jgi:GTPase SAR1 family protein
VSTGSENLVPFEGPKVTVKEAMTPSREIRKGRRGGAWKIVLYGPSGVGKSTLASKAPRPFFLDLEAGLEQMDIEGTPGRLTTYAEVLDWLRYFAKSDYQTVVIDTLDELEDMLARDICKKAGKETLVDIPYGKGGDLLVLEWQKVIDIFEKLRSQGKNIICTAQAKIEKFEDPTAENYDRYQIKIHKKTAPLVMAKMDAVFFARFETSVRKKDTASEKRRASTTGHRILHTTDGASWIAKNRYGLPETVLFEQLK